MTFLQINFPPMRAFQFITDHLKFKLHHNQTYQIKKPYRLNSGLIDFDITLPYTLTLRVK